MKSYERVGDDDLYVRFDPGFGLNVYIGRKWINGKGETEFGMGIGGWERLCELVDEWRIVPTTMDQAKEGDAE